MTGWQASASDVVLPFRGVEGRRHDGERVWRIVGQGGFCYWTSEARMAANYGGGRAEPRLPAPPTGRWALPGGIANQDGVVLACDFADGELTYSHRPNSHEEYVTAEGGAAFLSGRRPLPVGCRGARRVAARERRTVAPPLPHDLTCCPIRCPTPTAVEDRAKKPGLSGAFRRADGGTRTPDPIITRALRALSRVRGVRSGPAKSLQEARLCRTDTPGAYWRGLKVWTQFGPTNSGATPPTSLGSKLRRGRAACGSRPAPDLS
jgi:hypothetical protein